MADPEALYGCPVKGCRIFPYDRPEDLTEHVASGAHVFKVGRTRKLVVAGGPVGQWKQVDGVWLVAVTGANEGDVVSVAKRDGSMVDARLGKAHGRGLYKAVRA